MKKILITGKNSYIGTCFEKWVSQWPDDYEVTTVDTIGDTWKNMSFKDYDSILHTAAIVHQKEKKSMESLYQKVNCQLPFEIAQKAKNEGVEQFVFMSSMSVYGKDSGVITDKTVLNPDTFYGATKLNAEKQLKVLQNEKFKVVCVRPPMVYGKGCKGNYRRLSKFVIKILIFPKVKNIRSMIHIDNLCEFIKLLVKNEDQGVFFPQNDTYVNTYILAKTIAETHGKKLKTINLFNRLIEVLAQYNGSFKKVFGDLIYEKKMSLYKENYNIVSLKKSIELTEK